MRLLPLEYAVRNLGRSGLRLCLLTGAAMLVALLVLTAGAFVRGMDLSLRTTGGEHNVILLRAGSEEAAERSEIDPGVVGVVTASLPGVRSRAGALYASPEIHTMLPLRAGGASGTGPMVMVRGVTPGALLVHDSVQIESGRFPAEGSDEIMVGSMVAVRMGVSEAELAIGRTLAIDDREWRIVGRFVSPGRVTEAEVWVPLADLQVATRRQSVSCLIVTLEPDLAEFDDVDAFAKIRVDLELAAIREVDYYAQLADFFAPIRLVVWMTAGLIAIGGLVGGLNTMYAAFSARIREFATLQAIGFRRTAILISLVQESMLAAAGGAIVAAGIAVFVLNGVAVRFSLGTFGLVVDEVVLGVGLGAGLLLGFIGALLPAAKCLSPSIPMALRSV